MLKMTGFGAVLVAVLMLLTVIRHTRGEEEAGRTELMRRRRGRPAGPAGRGADPDPRRRASCSACSPPWAWSRPGWTPRGAWAFGLSWACAGAAFAAVGAVAAQLTGQRPRGDGHRGRRARPWRSCCGRSATSPSPAGPLLAVVALADRLGAADPPVRRATVGGSPLVPWCSPWWRSALAVALLDRRDLGAGLVPARPGPATAGRGLAHAARPGLAPAPRLVPRLAGRRSSCWPWCWATWPPDLGGLLDSPGAQDLITRMGGVQGLTDAFLSTEFGAAGVVAAAYGVQAVLRLRGGGVGAARRAGAGHGRDPVGVVGQPPAGGAGDLGGPDAGHGPLRRPRRTVPPSGTCPARWSRWWARRWRACRPSGS